eukprot:SAG22_NODE_71_length_22540_cov_8.918052_14_plen_45_part_00
MAVANSNYGFSFPNYLDRLAGTYEDGSHWQKKQPKGERGANATD